MSLSICLSITEKNIENVKGYLRDFDFCELRLDLIQPAIDKLEELLSINSNVIVTCRENKNIDREMYLKEAIKLKPEFVDIEFETDLSLKKELINLCEVYGVKRIHSYHNFESTPHLNSLIEITISEFSKFKPAIIKIATYVNQEKDNITLLSLLNTAYPLVVIGMGELGKKTRIIAPLFGSKFTFAGIDGRFSAPGQLDYYKVKEFYSFMENLIK